jgi:hypothetical protein
MQTPVESSSSALGAHLFRAVVVADTHMNQDEADCTSPFAVNALANARTRYVVQAINREQPDLVIHLGDLIHPVPSLPTYGRAADEFHSLTRVLSAPLHLVPGNHDVGDKPFAWGPSGIVRDSFLAKWTEHFGDHFYSFDFSDCHFVVINAQIINSELDAERDQQQWLEADLANHADQRTFIAIHYPPYLTDAGESESYDNLAEPGRSWLLGLIEEHSPEAMFAGHVHNFWYNRHRDTDCYVLPSTAFVRQDYSEFYRVEPGPEGGRNDAPKLGFFVVDIHEHGHTSHMVRTHGETLAPDAPAPQFPTKVPYPHSWHRTHRGIGLDLRQPWCEVLEVTASGALDEFERKRVRNDYPLLSMLEMGIQDLRVPLQDLLDSRIRARMRLLASRGHRFTVYSFELPDSQALSVIAESSSWLFAWEVVCNWGKHEQTLTELAKIRAQVGVATRISKLRSKDDMTADGSQYYHVINHGFTLAEVGQIRELLAKPEIVAAIDGVVWRVEIDDCPLASIHQMQSIADELGVDAQAQVRTVGNNPAGQQADDGYVADRAALASLGVAATTRVAGFLDSFADIDRGYFLRVGLVDRRYNPRIGWHVLRNLHGCLDTILGPLAVAGTSCADAIGNAQTTLTYWTPDAGEQVAVPGGVASGRAQLVCLHTGEVRDGTWNSKHDVGHADFDMAGIQRALIIAHV